MSQHSGQINATRLCDAADAALVGGPDLGHGHEPRPQALAIHPVGAHESRSSSQALNDGVRFSMNARPPSLASGRWSVMAVLAAISSRA